MAKVKIRYYMPTLKMLFNFPLKEEVIETEEITVKEMIGKLVEIHPQINGRWYDRSTGTLLECSITGLVNGRPIEFLQGIDTRLKDGDTLSLS